MNAVYRNQKTCRKPLLLSNNWYAYVHNDPVNFVDLWGLDVNSVGNLTQQSAGREPTIGNSDETIYDVGCVLTGYTRIASALSDQEITLEESNRYAIEKGLYTNGNELTIDNGVKLINGLISDTGKEVSYVKSITGTTNEIAQEIKKLEESKNDYYLTARLTTTDSTGNSMKHTVSINSDSVVWRGVPYNTSELNVLVNDTSIAGRTKIEDDKRDNSIDRVDVFEVKEKKNK